jgi:hypothetical protein
LKRVQVKTSIEIKDDKIKFDLTSSTTHRKEGVKHKYTSKEIDFFVVYNIESNILLLLPIEEFGGKTSVSFALDYNPSRNQFVAYNWKDFTFEKIMCVETLHGTSKDSDIYDEDKVQTTTDLSGLSDQE